MKKPVIVLIMNRYANSDQNLRPSQSNIERDQNYYRNGKYVDYITDNRKLKLFSLDSKLNESQELIPVDPDKINDLIKKRSKKQWIWDMVVSWGDYAKNNPIKPELGDDFPRLDFSDPLIVRRVLHGMMKVLLSKNRMKISSVSCFFTIHHGQEHGKDCGSEHIHAHVGFFELKPSIRVHEKNGGSKFRTNGNLGGNRSKSQSPIIFKYVRDKGVEIVENIFKETRNDNKIEKYYCDHNFQDYIEFSEHQHQLGMKYSQFAKSRSETRDFLNVFLKQTSRLEKNFFLEPLIKEFEKDKKYLNFSNMYYNNLSFSQQQLVNDCLFKLIDTDENIRKKYDTLKQLAEEIEFAENDFNKHLKNGKKSEFIKNNFQGKSGVIPRMANVVLRNTNVYLKERKNLRRKIERHWQKELYSKKMSSPYFQSNKYKEENIKMLCNKHEKQFRGIFSELLHVLNELDYLCKWQKQNVKKALLRFHWAYKTGITKV